MTKVVPSQCGLSSVTPTGGSSLMVGSLVGRLTYSARISPLTGTLVAPSGGLTARICAAAIVAARLPCWARRMRTKPPTPRAKTTTRRAPASCLAQFFIRPNNGRASEKVRQPVAQELGAPWVDVGWHQVAHRGFSPRDHRVDGLAGTLDRLADDQPNPFAQPKILRTGERHRQHRHMVVDGEMRKPLLEG